MQQQIKFKQMHNSLLFFHCWHLEILRTKNLQRITTFFRTDSSNLSNITKYFYDCSYTRVKLTNPIDILNDKNVLSKTLIYFKIDFECPIEEANGQYHTFK